jgi:hypothetical protein
MIEYPCIYPTGVSPSSRAHFPLAAITPLQGQEGLGDGHLRDVEFIVCQVALKERAGVERDALQVDILWLHGAILTGAGPADYQRRLW